VLLADMEEAEQTGRREERWMAALAAPGAWPEVVRAALLSWDSAYGGDLLDADGEAGKWGVVACAINAASVLQPSGGSMGVANQLQVIGWLSAVKKDQHAGTVCWSPCAPLSGAAAHERLPYVKGMLGPLPMLCSCCIHAADCLLSVSHRTAAHAALHQLRVAGVEGLSPAHHLALLRVLVDEALDTARIRGALTSR
jgi:hypothetical protein